MSLSLREQSAIDAANQSGHVPVVFVHGLWVLASSWTPWAEMFEAQGFAPVAVDWPGDPATVAEARDNPDAFREQTVDAVMKHLEDVVEALDQPPVVIGHSFGGLFAQKLAAKGASRATVALAPAPFKGVLPLPWSAIRSTLPVLGAPWTWGGAVQLKPAQFRYGWSNALADEASAELYERHHVPAPTRPLLAAATANVNPWASTRVDTRADGRGPLLLVAGDADHTVPISIVRAAFRLQQRNASPTRFEIAKGRGHSLTIDDGWRDVAELALHFVRDATA
ncbi:MAG: alpha/beta fold hydrolase [Myxococcota bacterium]